MIFYLPYPSFTDSMCVLDRNRVKLVSVDALTMLKSHVHFYPPHPRTGVSGFEGQTSSYFWAGHELQFAYYGLAATKELLKRALITDPNYSVKQARVQYWTAIIELMEDDGWDPSLPELVGDEEFHSGMRAFLLYKEQQRITYWKWRRNEYPDHACTRNLLPKKRSWRREHYEAIWDTFGRPDLVWYSQWGWTEEPDDMKLFIWEDRIPQMQKELERKRLRPVTGFFQKAHEQRLAREAAAALAATANEQDS